ncbi:hypothetical protein IWQ47_003094 [Aquimarina sp. EL_43]|uniref:hypothetical protein n=1 Tax=unclassified Aquimarina TaxID=2627091 RepID=UPI0018CA8706|nr:MULTISPECIES: hypothetical protein [unclassified Aquimarina]MBG6131587.1 hypothetical protein [Aquimarina sp. EL_35]MBG6152047.1 hypothetical protein [Aquimarina sp. EL_32]MBG6170009.1 hypothetical protein [Aquimarina sp. EL_43]
METIMKFSKYGILVLILVLSACADDGVDGQIGPQGPAGADGANGQDGNANVVSVLFENQTISNGDNVFDIPQLTKEIFDTGIVYAYVTVTGNNYWEVLPLSLGQQIILEIDKIEVGKATLRATFTQSNLRLRFVLVEGNDASGINFENYLEVQSFYNLTD